MKPNLPLPPSDVFGFRALTEHESDLDQEIIARYQYAEPSFELGAGVWTLYRPPNETEGVPIPGTKGMTLPGDHNRYNLRERVQS